MERRVVLAEVRLRARYLYELSELCRAGDVEPVSENDDQRSVVGVGAGRRPPDARDG